jgi:threonine aldolase
MYKYQFFNDYSEGVHPRILELMAATNLDQEEGYCNDSLSRRAEERIKQALENPHAAVHFVSGGTQANLIALAALLQPYESVIAAESAHINVHEAGAVESTGHKINLIPSADGKLTPEPVQRVFAQHTDEHMVKPKVVYISNSTEVGTAYTHAELAALSECCRQNDLYLYLDGARLGSALTSRGSDLSLPQLSQLVDAFYIGGTKNGALIGEALVINRPSLQPHFRFHIKQRGGLLAKGRLLGVQFLGLLSDNLYFDLARQANVMAERLAQGLQAQGYRFLTPSTTNQIFPILPFQLIDALKQDYGFYVWAPAEAGHAVIRLVTSWATPAAKVDEFIEAVRALSGKLPAA